jgi:hypothetical protein
MRRHTVSDLIPIARTYLLSVHHGVAVPKVVVMREHGLSRDQAGAAIRAARDAGLLPYVHRGQSSPKDSADHWPRMARWTNAGGRESWLACLNCRQPWPCSEAASLRWLAQLPNPEYL